MHNLLSLMILAGCATGPAALSDFATTPSVAPAEADVTEADAALTMRFGTVNLPIGVEADREELADRGNDTTTLTDEDGTRFELTWRFGSAADVYTMLKDAGADVEPSHDTDRGFAALLPDDGDGRCVYVSGRDGVVLFQSMPMPEDDDCPTFEEALPSLADIESVEVEESDEGLDVAWGTWVGSYNSVSAYSNGSTSYVGPYGTYGYQYQCVEYVNRYFVSAKGKSNMRGTGNANAYCSGRPSGISVYSNGSTTKPATGDYLASKGGTYGHVAIVREVGSTYVKVIQQNWSNSTSDNSKTLTLSLAAGKYTVGDFSASYPVSCWGR